MKIKSAVQFNIARLFNGAIDVDWLLSNPEKAEEVAESFVFHGPQYHGVTQKDVINSGHRLIDSASFFNDILNGLAVTSESPFTLAIAGFGSGKSHIALTLSELLETDNPEVRNKIINNMAIADERIANSVQEKISTLTHKVLVLTLNGMNNFDLSAQLLSEAKAKLAMAGLPLGMLEELRKRFVTAGNILQNLDSSLVSPLLNELGLQDKSEIIERLSNFDESVYSKTHEFLSSLGIPLIAIGNETAKDVLKLLSTHYVGEDKPYQKILILFDEFGRYLEFAMSNSSIAGNGALQHLYEGVQENSGKIAFVGFIQYELKAYEQRLPIAFKNEVSRFITRFQSAEKLYLSINLETLIASLLVKNDSDILVNHDNLSKVFTQIQRWYPVASNHTLWSTQDLFERVVGRGCWPLSPLSIWILFHLSAGGQYLQQRSALSLLKSALNANEDYELSSERVNLPPVCLWSDDLQKEFEDVEEQAGRGAIMQSYASVIERSQQYLSESEILLLRSIVLLSVSRLKASSREDALTALQVFSGLSILDCASSLQNLEEEKNVVSWDESFHQFDIIGDSVSKSQFLKFLRNKVDSDYDEELAEKLFMKNAEQVSEDLKDIECDFGAAHDVKTPEWCYKARFTYWKLFKQTAASLISQLIEDSRYASIDTARGIIVYCYVPPYENCDDVILETRALLRASAKAHNCTHLPVIVSIINDTGEISRILCELDAICKMSSQELDLYGKIANLYSGKRQETLKELIRHSLLERKVVTSFSTEDQPMRMMQLGSYVFDKIYPKIIPFPFDGYKSYRASAAKDCMTFTRSLLAKDVFTFDVIQAMNQQQRNRANTVLKSSWVIFNKDGSIAAIPAQPNVRSIVKGWESLLFGNKELNCGEALEMACAPPYGANIASAGLLFSVFIQTRQNIVTVVHNEERVDFSIIIDDLFDGSVLLYKFLEQITLFKNEESGSEWEQLLTDWSNAASYTQRVEFSEEADNLKKRLPIPQALRWKANELYRLAMDAKSKIAEADEYDENGFRRIEKGDHSQDVSLWAWGGATLSKSIKRRAQDPMWRQEDSQLLADQMLYAKQKVIQNFDSWLVRQRPQAGTPAALVEFRKILIEQCGSSIQELGLHSELEKLKKFYNLNARSIEVIGEAQRAIRDAEEWLAKNGRVNSSITVLQLDKLEDSLKAQMDLMQTPKRNMTKLSRVDMISEIDSALQQYQDLASKIAEERKRIEKKAKETWNITELTPEKLDNTIALFNELLTIYAGKEKDIQDFQMLSNAAESYRNILHRLKSMDISTDDFSARAASFQSDYTSRYGNFAPPWDVEQSFKALYRHCLTCREEASQKWFSAIEEKVRALATMTTAEANDLNRSLSTPPPYIDIKKETMRLERLQKALEDFLSTKEVEWLLEYFKRMSPVAQREFVKAIRIIEQNDFPKSSRTEF